MLTGDSDRLKQLKHLKYLEKNSLYLIQVGDIMVNNMRCKSGHLGSILADVDHFACENGLIINSFTNKK